MFGCKLYNEQLRGCANDISFVYLYRGKIYYANGTCRKKLFPEQLENFTVIEVI
ncbi:hypothetical protein M5D96_003857 [Drosophila gunungcola]|uniref:Uncharacterized protein n=1 Tax=Drosophila gunungcola TaxID=103775 RepID=A0A9Q0BSU5_9MUSC|nr:hypothetical protein M5D96_003857 [Drosophila gunungcola]